MLSVKICKPSAAEWVDHIGNEIEELIFSKEYSSNYVPGHYPLESLGSLYRNIDNFRESPLQSRTDWELRIPSIYSSADGKVSTVDLLYWLEGVNESAGHEFNLIGCEVYLNDNGKSDSIYCGVVESIAVSGETTSLRISDWLGNPKVGQSVFAEAVGIGDVEKWPVQIEKERGLVRLNISNRKLASKPKFFLKTGDDEWVEIDLPSNAVFSEGWMTASLNLATDIVLELDMWLPKDADFLMPAFPGGNSLAHGKVLRPDAKKDTPDFYLLGEGNNSEVIEAWSDRPWNESATGLNLFFSVGRPIPSERRSHRPPLQLKKMNDAQEGIFLKKHAFFPATSIILDVDVSSSSYSNDPYQRGNPSQLAYNSKNRIMNSFEHCPIIQLYLVIEFDVYLTGENFPSGTKICPNSFLFFSIKGLVDNAAPFLNGAVKINGETIYRNPELLLRGGFKLPLNDLQGFDLTNPMKVTFQFTRAFLIPDGKFEVGCVYAELELDIPLGDKLYASLEFEDSDSSDNAKVKPIIRKLLSMAGQDYKVEGKANDFEYGHVFYNETFALRDKLRSLAMESFTMISLSPREKEIKVVNIALEKGHESILIPLSAFVLNGNMYSFRMESPERGELFNEVTIYWGKDLETGRYDHVLSVSPDGIFRDSVKDELEIYGKEWDSLFQRMERNKDLGINKVVDSEWIVSWEAAEHLACNLLCWNTVPLRKAQANCIYTILNENIDIGSFVRFDLPGYHRKFAETEWMVTGRHDNLDTMVTALELLEVHDLQSAPSADRYLLLENGGNILLENGNKIKLEE